MRAMSCKLYAASLLGSVAMFIVQQASASRPLTLETTINAAGRMLACSDNRADCTAWGPSLCSNAAVKTTCPCMCGGTGGTTVPSSSPTTSRSGGTLCNDNRADCTAWGPSLCYNAAVKSTCPCMCGGTTAPPASPVRSGGSGGSGTVYSGDITYYNDVGTTACGEQINGDGNFAAISSSLASQLNTNTNWPESWCGRSARVTGPKGSALVRVIDKCPVCSVGSIDVAPSIFQAVVGDLGIGRAAGSFQFV